MPDQKPNLDPSHPPGQEPQTDQGTAEILAQARAKIDAIEADLDAKVEEFNQKATSAKNRYEKHQKIVKKEREDQGDVARGTGVGLTAAYAIVGLPLAGAGIGWLIDRPTGGNIAQGVGVLIGAVVGVAFALHVVNRHQ